MHKSYGSLSCLAVFSFLSASAADFSVSDYGARADGTTCTKAFEAAIAAANAAGGGRVVVPDGTWAVGSVKLRDNVELHLSDGAILSFSDDPDDYLPAVPRSTTGIECLGWSSPVYAFGCTNVALTGRGTLAPKMDYWRTLMRKPQEGGTSVAETLYHWCATNAPLAARDLTKLPPSALGRPALLHFNRCRGVRLDGVRIRQSPYWVIHFFLSDDVTVRNVDLFAYGCNNDALDIEMTSNVLVEDCTFFGGDDGICLKAGRNADGWRLGKPTENVTVRRCRIDAAHSVLACGSELSAGIRHVLVEDCSAGAVRSVLKIKTNDRRGGFVRDVTVRNVKVRHADDVFGITYSGFRWKYPDYELRDTAIEDVFLENVAVHNAREGVVVPARPHLPPKNVRLRNVTLDRVCGSLTNMPDATGVTLENVTVLQPGVPRSGVVFDRLENADRYAAISPNFAKAIAFLKRPDLFSLQPGRYVIDGTEVFANVEDVRLKPLEESKAEVHRAYADIQMTFGSDRHGGPGSKEFVGFGDLPPGVAFPPFKPGRDGTSVPALLPVAPICENLFMIAFPGAVHAPCLSDGATTAERKICIKVRMHPERHNPSRFSPRGHKAEGVQMAGKADVGSVTTSGEAFGEVRRVAEAGPDGAGLFLDAPTLYCGAGSELCVFDVRVPDRPRLLSRVTGIGRPRQVVAKDGVVYAAARGTGVWVIDARQREAAKVVTRFDTVELATGLALAGDVLFVSLRNNGVEFVDITDFRHPVHVDIRKTPESQSVAYSDGWLYSGEWGSGGVTVFDAHDMADIRDCGMVRLKGYGDGVAVFGDRLFASTGHHRKDASRSEAENYGLGHGLEIFDISGRRTPRFLSRVDFPKFFRGGQDWWTVRPSEDGRTVFAADTYNGVFAVDVSDVRRPRIAGRLVVARPDADGRPAPEAVSYLAVGSNVVYFTSQNYGLGVVSCPLARPYAAPTGVTPVNVGTRKPYATPADSHFTAWLPPERVQVRGAAAFGNHLYAACGAAGLWALEPDAKGGLKPVRRLAPRFCADVAIRDGRLYSAEDIDGVAVYGLSDPLVPRELARSTDFAGTGLACAIWVVAPSDRFAVVCNRSRYYVLDAQTLRPTGKSFSRCPCWGRYMAEEIVGGRYLALHGCNAGFGWIDLGGDIPQDVGRTRVNTCGQSDNACAFRGGRLLRMSYGQMQLLQPGESAERKWTGVVLPDKCTGYPAWDGGNRVALTSRIGRTVAMVDVADESHPRILWKERLVGNPDRSFFWQGRLVMPCGYQGVMIEKWPTAD